MAENLIKSVRKLPTVNQIFRQFLAHFGLTNGKSRHQRPWVARDLSFWSSNLAINRGYSGRRFSRFELQIDLIFEQIEAPNHKVFVAHEVRIISGNFEKFWTSFEG